MSESWFKQVLAEFRCQTLGPLETYKILLLQHAGVPPEQALQLMRKEPGQGLRRNMDYHWDKLVYPTATKAGITTQELKGYLKGITLGSVEDEPFINSWTDFDGNRFIITINLSLMVFFWKMSKLWATRINFKDVPGIKIEHTKFRLDETAEMARNLMQACLEGRILTTDVIDTLSLSTN